jgi:hypothetical protein
MTHSEQFALDQWLSSYPQDASYETIMEMLTDGEYDETTEAISVWEVVEHYPLWQVADLIEDTRGHFESAVRNMQQSGEKI